MEPDRHSTASGGTHAGRSAADTALAAALLGGATWDQGAAAAGVSRRTVARRLADPMFRGHLDSLRRNALARAADRLGGLSVAAVDTLEDLLTSDETAPVRLGAARVVLAEAHRFFDVAELDARVAAIEETLRHRRRSA